MWCVCRLPYVQIILILSWMAMLVHQFEEYGWPGGFPSITNYASMGETEHFDSYPLNSLQCFISNVFLCYATYIIPIFFPELIWLAAGQIFMGIWQIPGHIFLMNIRLKTFYNPGMFATLFLQLPLVGYFIWFVCTAMPDVAIQLWWGIPVSFALNAISFFIPVALGVRNRNYDHPFRQEELYGWKGDMIREWQAQGKHPASILDKVLKR